MSSPEDESKQHALAREWAAARIVVIGGLLVAVAVAGYFAYRDRQATLAQQQAAAPIAVTPRKVDIKAVEQAELAVCTAELDHAIRIGIIPNYGALATSRLARTAVNRRFVCVAGTHLTKYFIAADLRCNNLRDPQCISVYRIASKDGQLLYSRPQ
jgi:predicted negative regulator of RcsB-dependent stress response